ncbi:hypothetical protein FJTKL_10365 [Diaporthe vaccinii]|uniref:Uncharacterized protein n=1 Tax=Diaporthe vaccinii TaxID=105482 RepID=A0ABR4EJX9_9PEZI
MLTVSSGITRQGKAKVKRTSFFHCRVSLSRTHECFHERIKLASQLSQSTSKASPRASFKSPSKLQSSTVTWVQESQQIRSSPTQASGD